MTTTHRLLVLLVVISSWCIPVSYASTDGMENAMPALLQTVVAKKHPDMKVSEVSNIDAQSCGRFGGDHPGWIAGDFNGDGLEDYAALLVGIRPIRTTKHDGKTYAEHKFLLVVYVRQANNQLKEITLHKSDDLLPTNKGIKLQLQGEVFDLDASRTVSLSNVGIAFYSCEQFAWVFYWNGKLFMSVVTSR